MRSRARHWSRTAFAVALLFGVMAVGSRMILGAWPFDGAPELAVLSLAFGAYFHVISRRRKALPDPAALLEEALTVAGSGRMEEAVALLTEAIRQSPQLWQAFQYRGELYLLQQNPAAAARDFSEAIRLAPQEQHLYTLREQANGPAGAA